MALGKDLLLAGGLGGAMLLAIIVANSGSDAPVQTAPPIPQAAAPIVESQSLPPILPDDLRHSPHEHRADLVEMLTMLRAQHPYCKSEIDPSTTRLVDVLNPDPINPEFQVLCERGRQVVRFNWLDMVNKRLPPVVPKVDRTAAVTACESRAKSWATNPQTVSFSRVWDMVYRDNGNGSATIRTAFTAKNAFNLELKFAISCEYAGGRITHSSVSEYQ